MDIGMSEKERSEVAKKLEKVLADTYALYLKTQNFHWNFIGKNFYGMHVLLQKQYEELAEAIDEIAERIRSLGQYVEGNFTIFQKNSFIKEEKKRKKGEMMVKTLVDDHEKFTKTHRPSIHFCQDKNDEMSGDLLIKRIAQHEKFAYLLRSHLAS